MRKSREDEYQKNLRRVEKDTKEMMDGIMKLEKRKRMERFQDFEWLREQYVVDFPPLSYDEQNVILDMFVFHGAPISILFKETRNRVVLRFKFGFLFPLITGESAVAILGGTVLKRYAIAREKIIAVSSFKVVKT